MVESTLLRRLDGTLKLVDEIVNNLALRFGAISV
jgi:hypothetical protein